MELSEHRIPRGTLLVDENGELAKVITSRLSRSNGLVVVVRYADDTVDVRPLCHYRRPMEVPTGAGRVGLR
jgi:hypothetical protein